MKSLVIVSGWTCKPRIGGLARTRLMSGSSWNTSLRRPSNVPARKVLRMLASTYRNECSAVKAWADMNIHLLKAGRGMEECAAVKGGGNMQQAQG